MRGATVHAESRTVPCAAHCVVSFMASKYLRDVASGAARRSGRIGVTRLSRHSRRSALDADDWHTLEEDTSALRDAYEHDRPPSDEGDMSDDG